MRFSTAFTLVAVVFWAAVPVGLIAATTDEDQPLKPQQADDAGTIRGQIVLPSAFPKWFRGGKLSLEDAEVVIEGMYRGPRMNRPKNYSEMTKEERIAWSQEYQKTDEYKDYQRKKKAAYESRPVTKFPVNPDGSFTIKGLELARYNVIPVIPHPAAKGKEVSSQSWGAAFKQIVLSEERKAIDVGKMELKLKNVVMPGDAAPSWTAQAYDGEPIESSDFHGKYLIVDFWATWCSPCIAEIPNLEKVYEEFGGDRFGICGLSIDASLELPTNFLEERSIAYPQAYLGQWNDDETTTKAFGIVSVPSIWLIGPDGKVIARDLAGEEIGAAVRDALNQSATKK